MLISHVCLFVQGECLLALYRSHRYADHFKTFPISSFGPWDGTADFWSKSTQRQGQEKNSKISKIPILNNVSTQMAKLLLWTPWTMSSMHHRNHSPGRIFTPIVSKLFQ